MKPYAGQYVDYDGLAEDLTYSIAVFDGDRVIACGGVRKVFDGVGEAWSVLSDEALRDHPMAVTRHAKKLLDRAQEDGKFKRLQALCLDENIAAHNWLRRFGFELEGLHPNAGPGGEGTYCTYGRVR